MLTHNHFKSMFVTLIKKKKTKNKKQNGQKMLKLKLCKNSSQM